ncbi:ceramide glucosyltransferase [Mesorhizobium sp. M2D.F.Ca.ET.185.01.1.1]|uniref:ceramide glucosyltransferase n=1 Tax=unclassified Mesorhizobium TaxID=325217 RepID=UPI000FC99DFC|nr:MULTISPECIES: ceramide glucosyltransferase [unclassified Mesorhizobium]TGP51292.1 ceramide glucosyltransferase [bacterium M00.F.Ca.ET.230.01.1.1]TGP73428.1 ceramide glucosyltransferase [bacterium M00.F.Ca.ET.227.01.1.1]TGP84437.1 ceramide glucosyltransferase [bacterium M00.F.Ca.ET.221.01.1.1]TGP87051.1 ceramide glucosyltransferase [bacterium M00.F.Ca.ET.222.01.1.1]TGT97336.1 ceramide glucosyltransferase [bacterium M00.F.Ca.ET.163.01.1.1]TGU22454.1 ceramide glucosyltransferase [bacterium M0
MELTIAAALTSSALLLSNLASILLAASRLKRRRVIAPPAGAPSPVTIIVPSRGVEPFTQETLQRAFLLDWPRYELIFCVAQAEDPVVKLISAAIARHPKVAARLLVGEDRVSANPKLNNCVKGWQAARHDWVILADSNVLMPRDYVQQLMAAWRPDTGLVCSTPIGSRPDGFWAEVECGFLNSLQARWQYAGEALGLGFAQGKSMLWNKPMLDANGGIEALGAESAEDAAATKLVNSLGLRVNLVASPFEQPLGQRTFAEIWARQTRWARLRRVTFPLFFAPEILTGAAVPLLLALLAAASVGASLPSTALCVLAIAYLPECLLAWAKGWYLSPRSITAMIVRDAMLPAIWARGWFGGAVDWRGNAMTIRAKAMTELEEPA